MFKSRNERIAEALGDKPGEGSMKKFNSPC